MRPALVSLFILALGCGVAGAQQPALTSGTRTRADDARARLSARRAAEKERTRVDVVDAQLVTSQSAWLARYRGIGTTLHTSADEQTIYLLVRRSTSSKPEVHARWDDLVIVRSGTGALQMGDSLLGSTYRAPGERIGGEFAKSYQVMLHAGDVVRIPAAVPHAFIVSATDPLEYLLIKHRRQELPIRWYGDP